MAVQSRLLQIASLPGYTGKPLVKGEVVGEGMNIDLPEAFNTAMEGDQGEDRS
jgi:hypothetical protein